MLQKVAPSTGESPLIGRGEATHGGGDIRHRRRCSSNAEPNLLYLSHNNGVKHDLLNSIQIQLAYFIGILGQKPTFTHKLPRKYEFRGKEALNM